jgi:hypothetical protein
MAAKGLFADTLSGVGPDANASVQQNNTHLVEPMSSLVNTWRGSGERVVIHIEQPELSSLVSTQRGSGAYAKVATMDYHTEILAGQTLPLGTRVDPQLSLAPPSSVPPVTPPLSQLPLEPASPLALTAPPFGTVSLLPNTLSLAANMPARRSWVRHVVAAAGCLVLASVLAIPSASQPEAMLVPTLASQPLASHSKSAGLVGKVHVAVGDIVVPGQVLVSLDENERASRAERLRMRIDQLDNELEQLVSNDQRLHHAALGALRRKRALLVDRLAQRSDDAANHGQSEDKLQLRQQLAEVDFLRNDRQRSFEQHKRSTEAALSEAHAELLEVNSLELTARATLGARVSRILVEPGQPVAAGAALVELTLLDAKAKLVGFIADEAASRIATMEPALINLGEIASASDGGGVYDARVTFVANTPSQPEEVQSVLGVMPAETMRRVELAWPQDADTSKLGSLLAAGAPVPRVNAKFVAPDEPLGVQWLRSAKRVLQNY